MRSASFSVSGSPSFGGRDWLMLAGLALVAAMLIAVNPIGYIGGHWDDGRYLAAAQAWVAHGAQLGHNHWSLRWPVVLPAVLAIHLFAATRDVLMLPALAAFAALLVVYFAATRRAFGIEVAALAGFALVTTPELLIAATRLTADLPEALFWSAAIWALWFAGPASPQRRAWLIGCGIAAGLAWATRETSLGLLLLIACAFVCRWREIPRRAYGWVSLGFCAVALPEMALLARASGDLLYRFHIDLRHVQIASDNLAGGVDAASRVIADPELMARWRGSGPVRLFWPIDPWINLFAHPAYGLGFGAAAVAAIALRLQATALRLQSAELTQTRRLIRQIAFAVTVQVAVIVYVIATDPKPRMFLPSVVMVSLAFALAAHALLRTGRGPALVAALIAGKLIMTFVAIDLATTFADVPAHAEVAEAAAYGPVEVDRWTLSELALAPADAHLTQIPAPELLVIGKADDHGGSGSPPPGRWKIIWQSPPDRAPIIVRIARRIGLHIDAARTPIVTLYHAAR
jgi:4-amino-4-deoxy-L-arabinose transferase-like glycosyltransferase